MRDIKQATFHWHLASWWATFFRAKILRTEKRQVQLRFWREGLPAAFHKFSRALKIWVFRLHPLTKHLSFSPSCPQWEKHIKRSPYHETQQSFNKRERMGTQVKLNIKSNESTKNDKRAGTAVWHRQIPQLPHFGQCPRDEETVLRAAVPVGALWQLHLQCIVEPPNLLCSKCLTSKTKVQWTD